jgi:ABC-type multidrug transport system ATPase subunit
VKSLLSVESISHQFGSKPILDNITFTCEPGEILALFGRNGSGKSTLLKILFGALKIQKGVLRLNNQLIRSNITDKVIAYCHQEVFLPLNITAREIIPLYYSNPEDQNKIFYAPGIAKLETSKIGQLSQGEQRYLQFLLLINLPHPFILLDEPFSMVDPLHIDIIKSKIIEISAHKGIILTDHYYKDAWEIATRRVFLHEGKLNNISDLTQLAKFGYVTGSGL